MFVIRPSSRGRTATVTVALPPPAMSVSPQKMGPLPPHAPWLVLVFSNVTWAGSTSVMLTAVAVNVPLLLMTTVYVKTSPTPAGLAEALLLTLRSAASASAYAPPSASVVAVTTLYPAAFTP